MKCNVVIGDKLNVLPDRQYGVNVPMVSLSIKEHWDKILDILTDKGIWDDYPNGYVESISIHGIKVYES